MKKIKFLFISFLCIANFYSQKNVFGSSESSDFGSTEPKDSTSYYLVNDEPAEFPGGILEMKNFIASNMVYPQKAIDAKIEGKIYMRFMVDTSGLIKNITILKGLENCLECNQECIRVIQLMPKWKPAKYKGKPVISVYSIPFNFRIPVEEESEKRKRKNN